VQRGLSTKEKMAEHKKAKAKSVTEGLALSPWAEDVQDENTVRGEERVRWREALQPCVARIIDNMQHPGSLRIEDIEQANVFARAVTLTDPVQVGLHTAIPMRRIWTIPKNTPDNNFTATFERTFCSPEDRIELLKWLGRATARVNWRSKSAGSGTAVTAVAATVFIHWTAIAWRDREVPDFCIEGVAQTDRLIYPKDKPSEMYRPWSEVGDEMHEFLSAWQEERKVLAQKKPRRNVQGRDNNITAKDMSDEIFLLRAFATVDPKSVNLDDIDILRSMAYIINTPHRFEEFTPILAALEDRQHLERGLARIADTEQETPPPARRRKL
jgi:hypothetical protein